MQPEHITSEMFAEALERPHEKKPSPGLDRLRLERFREDLCVQTMHIGPYSEEPAPWRACAPSPRTTATTT
jgi:hypothetical protein